MSNETGIVILDDSDSNFIYGDQPWASNEQHPWYKGVCHYPDWANGGNVTANFNLTFEGTSIAFIGNTPARSASQVALVSIDDALPYESDFSDPDPQSYVQWYQSPILPDGPHTISLSQLSGVALDIALVTVGSNTSLDGMTLFIDNEDVQVEYSGSGWTINRQRFRPGSLPDGYPVHNTTHQSSNVGDSMTFKFTGTTVSLYGIFNFNNIGRLDVKYTLDNSSIDRSYVVAEQTPNLSSGDNSNFLYFSKDGLPAGPHVLVASITNTTNLQYTLDYITYAPSFPNLASRPDLKNLTLLNSAVLNPKPIPTFTPSASNDTSSKSVPPSHAVATTAAIVGGVIGSLALLFFLFVFLWFRRNIQYIKRREESQPHIAEMGLSSNVSISPRHAYMPNIPSIVSRYGGISPFPPTPRAPLHATTFNRINPESKFNHAQDNMASHISLTQYQTKSSNNTRLSSATREGNEVEVVNNMSPPAYDPRVVVISDAPRPVTSTRINSGQYQWQSESASVLS